MSVSTLPLPSSVGNPSVSPHVSQAEILSAVASGTMTVEQAAPLLATACRPAGPTPAVRARRTARGAMWLSLGYRASKGCQNSITLPRCGWEAIVKLVKDGTIPNYLGDYDAIPLSASAAKGGAV